MDAATGFFFPLYIFKMLIVNLLFSVYLALGNLQSLGLLQ